MESFEKELIEVVEDLNNFRNNAKYLLPYTLHRNIVNYCCSTIPRITTPLTMWKKKDISESIITILCLLYEYIRFIESKVNYAGMSNSQKEVILENLETAKKILDNFTRE